jgi:uncharacterized membrane protein YhaH (DUF805 family)
MNLSQTENKMEGGKSTGSKKPNVEETKNSAEDVAQTKKMARALVKCSDCGNSVSKRAKLCPNCGAPIGGDRGFGSNERFGLNPLFVRIKQVFKYWFDAYKRIFDICGTSDRKFLFSFLGVQFIIDYVLNYLAGEFILTSIWIIGSLTILSTYAMFSLGLRRLNDIGISKKWAWVLGLIFVVGYVCDLINSEGIISPFFWSVHRIDKYLYVLLLFISWIRGGNRNNQSVGRDYLFSITGFLVYVLLFCLAGASLTRGVDRFKMSVKNNLPYKSMTCTVSSRDDGSSVYIINTDGPANAQIIAVYVMGRLSSADLIQCDNKEAADEVLKQIKQLFELEGALLNVFKFNRAY